MKVPSFRAPVSSWLSDWLSSAESAGATLHLCEVYRGNHGRGRPASRWLCQFSAPWIDGGLVEFSGNRRAVHEFLCSCLFGRSLVV